MQVPLVLIDERRRDEYFRTGYAPLAPGESIAEHKREWRTFVSLLDIALSQRWTQGIGEGDFFLDLDVVADRFVCVEVSAEEMLCPALLRCVHDLVAAFPRAYSVDICDSWGYLKTKDRADYPHFNVFVEREQILVFTESAELLGKLGLSGSAVYFPPTE